MSANVWAILLIYVGDSPVHFLRPIYTRWGKAGQERPDYPIFVSYAKLSYAKVCLTIN